MSYSIARWDSRTQQWDDLQGGINGDCRYNNSVYTIAATHAGIYIGGSFLSVGGANNTQNLAMWNTQEQTWEGVGGGLDVQYFVKTLMVYNETLYIGGKLAVASDGNTTSQNIAVWDITRKTWLPYSGVTLTSAQQNFGYINAMTLMGDSLVIGGCFDSANGVIVNNIAVGYSLLLHVLKISGH